MQTAHLVILRRPYLVAILSGQKTIESRFMKRRCPPFGRVKEGDKLFLKISAGEVCATAIVAAVKYFEDLTPAKILAIKRRYNEQIRGAEEYWRGRIDCECGFLVWLSNVKKIEPVRIKKIDWRAWVVLDKRNNFGLF